MPYVSVNPTTGEVNKQFPNHTDAEIDTALDRAQALYKSSWSKGPAGPRLAVLQRLAGLVEERAEELARILVKEMGKRISEARAEVQITAAIARNYAENGEKFLASHKLDTPKGDTWIEYHALGVIVAVEPWNYPYYQLVRVAAPNVAVGNPVLAKHAGIVPLSALAFEELMTSAGAPQGAWTNIFASGEQIARLIEDDRVQGVALTGSEKAGGIVAAQAGKYLKKSLLELGGSDVFMVLDDADLDKAEVVGQIDSAGGQARAYQLDVARKDEFKQVVDAVVADFGKLDVLINNAGLMPIRPMTEVNTDEWDAMIDINLKGVLYGIAATLPLFLERGSGHVINISSVAGTKVFSPGGTVYFGHQVRRQRHLGGAAP